MTHFPHYDAHCHWQSNRLLPHRARIRHDLEAAGVARVVVNGTCPQDWQQVADLALADSRVLPAFGLHPWHVNAVCVKRTNANTHTTSEPAATAACFSATDNSATARLSPANNPAASRPSPTGDPAGWLDQLKAYLKKFPQAAVGEIGLDNWIPDADKALQREAFLAQLALAAEGNRPVSVHCLRADGDLLNALKAAGSLPARGIHLHGFAGSIETARQLLDMGAHFSFSEYVATPKRIKARALAGYIPLDRLLAETDAPDMIGPLEWQYYRLDNEQQTDALFPQKNTPHPPKHPANITAAYACLAKLRGLPLAQLASIVEENFLRYFESQGSFTRRAL